MAKPNTIYVYEYGTLKVGGIYNGRVFEETHFNLLAKYLTENPFCAFFSLLHQRVRFANYVGVIKVGDLTIEVLPKTDQHEEEDEVWQRVLINMLAISLQVEAQATTHADIQIKSHSVLETYIQLFVDEVRSIVHEGLVKKYRRNVSNQTALKGRLLIHQHVVKNLVHAERFYVQHTVYDRDNVYNFILRETLRCIDGLNISSGLSQSCKSLLIDFPECRPVRISEKLFQKLAFDRKTERYKTAIQLARIILLNYHPDIKGGHNHVLAIMFDMNRLWEIYLYWSLKRAHSSDYKVEVRRNQHALFWQHPDQRRLRLNPDLLVDIRQSGTTHSFILDAKWKYDAQTSMGDVRQMFAYTHYFSRDTSFLIYPGRLAQTVDLRPGHFYLPGSTALSGRTCGIGFVDVIRDKNLNRDVGVQLVAKLRSTLIRGDGRDNL